MTRVGFIIRELVNNLIRHPGTAFASFLSLTLILLLFDLFWVASGTSREFYRELLSDLEMEVFVAEETPDSLLSSLESRIIGTAGVKTVTFVSRDSARVRLQAMVGGDLLAGYDETNPLPRSFSLTFWPEQLNLADMDRIENELSGFLEVDRIYYSRRWLEKAETTRELIWQFGALLGLLILITGLVTTANNIRLMAGSRAVGFRQMQLLGAGSLFIALPLLIESFLLGGGAAAAGWALLKYGSGQVAFTQFTLIFPPNEQILWFCLALACLAVLSGYLGLRNQLKWR
ncbi:MAG: permease-like cell division protein FtsX [bacterium]|nr:permease-like cell division protein FtsX [bacterium]